MITVDDLDHSCIICRDRGRLFSLFSPSIKKKDIGNGLRKIFANVCKLNVSVCKLNKGHIMDKFHPG